jgi:hypothetical protein
MSAKDRIESILQDLFSLEVNTILKDGMTATKAPPPAAALRAIANRYTEKLSLLSVPRSEGVPPQVTRHTFELLSKDAGEEAEKLKKLGATLTAEDGERLVMLSRIRDTSTRLRLLVPTGTTITAENEDTTSLDDLNDQQRLRIRKAWEVGTEQVVMQTVVYLDGDVITRIHPSFADKPSWLGIHQRSVNVSVSFWKGLVDLLQGLLTVFKRV